MEDFQKIIVQMMEQQVLKPKELQQQQQQRNEEILLQSLMKSEERQNQMEELLLKSLNGTKTSENDITMHSTIETFEYVPENDKTFDAFKRIYDDVFNVDCKEWSNEKKVRLLHSKLGTSEHSRLVNFYSPFPQKKKKQQGIWSFQRQVNYYLNCLGRTHHLFIRDGNAFIYLRMTNDIIWHLQWQWINTATISTKQI